MPSDIAKWFSPTCSQVRGTQNFGGKTFVNRVFNGFSGRSIGNRNGF